MYKSILPEESPLVKQAFQRLDEFMHYSVKQEKMKKFEKNAQGIGSAKRPFGQNNSKLSEQEKQELAKRKRIQDYLRLMQEGKLSPEVLA